MKIQKKIAFLTIVSLLLGACGTDDLTDSELKDMVNNETVTAETEKINETYENVQGIDLDSERYKNMVSYTCEQELQVIDDAYRNYYEIFVGSFYDSDGDGMGDLQGVIEKLDYLNDGDDSTDTDLGINGIWLMPIMPSTTYHKYDVTDYRNIAPEYGTMEDFLALVEACHERGIRLIIDFEMNHSSSKHPWFEESCKYLNALEKGKEPDVNECPYVDYYHFVEGSAPNKNYYRVGTSDWYYEGMFWSEMPDLNLESDALRAEFDEIIDFWIATGVDGFRMDGVKEFYSGEASRSTAVLKWFSNACHSKKEDFYLVGEVWENMSTFSPYYESGIDSLFNFAAGQKEGLLIKTVNGQYDMKIFADSLIKIQDTISIYNEKAIDAPFVGNHDMARTANIFANDEDKCKMVTGLLMTMNGNPFIYYGEEIGMSSSGSKDENKRTHFIWSDTDKTGETKDPIGADTGITSGFASLEVQMEDPLSIYSYYKRAIRLRNENPELARGKVAKVEALCKMKTAAITKTYNDTSIGVCYNMDINPVTLSLENTELSEMKLRGYLTIDGSEATLSGTELTIPARSIVILK